MDIFPPFKSHFLCPTESWNPHRWSAHRWRARRKARPRPSPEHCGPAPGTHTALPPSAPWRDSSCLRWAPCWLAAMTARWCPSAPAGSQWWEIRRRTLGDSMRGPQSRRPAPGSLVLLWGLWVFLQGGGGGLVGGEGGQNGGRLVAEVWHYGGLAVDLIAKFWHGGLWRIKLLTD